MLSMGLKLACEQPELRGIDPHNLTYYFRRVMVILESAEFSVTFWRLVTCAHSRRATVR